IWLLLSRESRSEGTQSPSPESGPRRRPEEAPKPPVCRAEGLEPTQRAASLALIGWRRNLEMLFKRSQRANSLLVVLVIATAGIVTMAPTAQGASEPLRYVALGDSYSAASGVLPPDPTAPPECLRSSRNYPHVIAGAIGANLTDVTCGAAETSDFFNSQY